MEATYSESEIRAALAKHLLSSFVDRAIADLRLNRLFAEERALFAETEQLIDRSRAETGAAFLRTQDEIDDLFARRHALAATIDREMER